jgi:arylsulfatase
MNKRVASLIFAASAACNNGPEKDQISRAVDRPNFLVIVADDLGYSDLGFVGSEIKTPNLDALAAEGLVMTHFYVSPACSPTRAMLLTGTDTHPAGLGTMAGEADENQEGQPGYEGVMSDRVVTIARLLLDAGYHTYLSGKWHLGTKEGMRPHERGFERSFTTLEGGASHFSDGLSLLFENSDNDKATYLKDGEKLDALPTDFFSSEDFTDQLIEQIREGSTDGRPFFAYAAYTAPHWPLQAPEDYIDRYAGIYDEGYDVLRVRRVTRLKAEGILPDDAETPPLVPWASPWDSLSDEQKRMEARKMELYAAMVENLDHHIGRLIDYLKMSGLYENTVVFFFSDNGAEGNPIHNMMDNRNWITETFDNSLGNMGRPGSYVYTGPGWAQASTGGFRFFKTFPSEGGIRVPAIAAGGAVEAVGRTDAFVSVKDVVPTLLDLSGVESPGLRYKGRDVASIEGESMVSLLLGRSDKVHESDYTMGWELFGRRAMVRGDWKLVWIDEPYGDGQWWLFNLASDPTESTDLSKDNPEKLEELLTAWDAYVAENGVILPASDTSYAIEDPW